MNYRFGLMLTIVRLIREHGTKMPIPSLAEKMDKSENYLNNLVNVLVKGGVLISQAGRGGGYSLARPGISVWDVYKVACGDGGLTDDPDKFLRQTAAKIKETMEGMDI